MWKNTKHSYGLIAIIIHWLVAASVVGLFALGLYMVELTYYDKWYKGSLDLHKSVGLTLAVILLVRVAIRLSQTQPQPLTNDKVQVLGAKFVHLLLYVLLLALFVSGYLISTADGRGIEVFGLFTVPAIGRLVDNQEDIAGIVHLYVAWTVIGAASLHALAALKHHFINRDRTLVRMLKVTKGNKS
ncbi:cytochrome b [Pseudoalteromonas sp. SSDWG2]|uniref:cytochrome b n=1 Tax=Pseudoalteromonas sp. SSDWG2 TaxID=3139391 RepID=UPI003BAD258E